jgi:copper(I)-binding protein
MPKILAPLLAALAGAACLAPVQALSHAYDVGDLHVGHPWMRPTPNGAPTAAGYLTVTNHGKTADRLLGGASPLARSIEPHSMSMSGGVMRMRLLPNGFEIPPGGTLTLAPDKGHLMLIGPAHPFKVGDKVPATLRFAHAGEVKVYFAVQADAPAEGGSMPGMDMH